jgi:cellulose synthase/poly-beta-1,6-N-acetylglucosamine synthase-like glycosyltransferase
MNVYTLIDILYVVHLCIYNIYIYKYISIYTYIYIYVFMFIYTGGEAGEDLEWFAKTSELFTFKGLYTYMRISVFVHTYVNPHLFIYVYTCASICT